MPAEHAGGRMFAGLYEALEQESICCNTPALRLRQVGIGDGVDGRERLFGNDAHAGKVAGSGLVARGKEELADSSFVLARGEEVVDLTLR